MILNLRLMEANIENKLRVDTVLKPRMSGEYLQFIISEYSRARLTHDTLDNFYYHDPSVVRMGDGYGVSDEETRSRRR